MKNLLLAFIALFVLSINTAVAADININKYTSDYKIKSALNVLAKNDAVEIFNNLEQEKVKIMFYDFSMISFSHSKHYAMKAANGNQKYILINTRHKDAPPEAIACLIVHESFHKLSKPTFEEEVNCTTQEAIYWSKLSNKDANYNDDLLVKRLNDLNLLYLASDEENNLIKNKIANNSFYKSQLVLN